MSNATKGKSVVGTPKTRKLNKVKASNDADEYLSLKAIVEMYGYKNPVSANASMRYAGITRKKIGNRVFYKKSEVEAYRKTRWERGEDMKRNTKGKMPNHKFKNLPDVLTAEEIERIKSE